MLGFLATEHVIGEADGAISFTVQVSSGALGFNVSLQFLTVNDSAQGVLCRINNQRQ